MAVSKPGDHSSERREVLIGTLMMESPPSMAGLFGAIGFDFVLLDRQHGSYCIADVRSAVAEARRFDCSIWVRVGLEDYRGIEEAGDAGATGIVVPMVRSAEQARLAVSACSYPPEGRRSVGGLENFLSGFAGQPAGPMPRCFLQIEDEAGVAAADEICEVPGVAGIFVGRVDLARSLGIEANYGAPAAADQRVEGALERIAAACAANELGQIEFLDPSAAPAPLGNVAAVLAGSDLQFLGEGAQQACRAAEQASRQSGRRP